MDDVDPSVDRTRTLRPGAPLQPKSAAELKPKGACWYCNQPLDNVRRFCSKTCAEDYRLEEEAFIPPSS
jgi:hypothetical protein